ncbi:hypothetical protein J6590_094787 [Homalodisca vitripennis]|nr:hypothetical protein J6590_094787 [Homalodisca vitripennis]
MEAWQPTFVQARQISQHGSCCYLQAGKIDCAFPLPSIEHVDHPERALYADILNTSFIRNDLWREKSILPACAIYNTSNVFAMNYSEEKR